MFICLEGNSLLATTFLTLSLCPGENYVYMPRGEFITSDSAGIRDMPRPPSLRTALAVFFRPDLRRTKYFMTMFKVIDILSHLVR